MHQRSGLDLVIERACLDRAFRQRLLAEPKAAIKAIFGVDLPDQFTLRFIERSADVDLLIVLPDLVGGELEDQDLRRVFGGAAGSWLFEPDVED